MQKCHNQKFNFFVNMFCVFPSLTHLPSLCLWYLHLTVPFPCKFSFFRVIYNCVAILLQEILECGVRGVPSTVWLAALFKRAGNIPPPPHPPTTQEKPQGGGGGGASRKPAKEDKKPEQIVCAWQFTAEGGQVMHDGKVSYSTAVPINQFFSIRIPMGQRLRICIGNPNPVSDWAKLF
jgi:hypothetical protein